MDDMRSLGITDLMFEETEKFFMTEVLVII